MTHGRLGLDVDEALVVLDVEGRLGGVADQPGDHGRDLDRVAVGVVDLEHVGVEVADPQREGAPGRQRVDPVEPGTPHRAHVVAQEDRHLGLVGLDDEEPVERHHQHQGQEHGGGARPGGGVPAGDRGEQQHRPGHGQQQPDGRRDQAGDDHEVAVPGRHADLRDTRVISLLYHRWEQSGPGSPSGTPRHLAPRP
jgi:hypothetical protein